MEKNKLYAVNSKKMLTNYILNDIMKSIKTHKDLNIAKSILFAKITL